MKNYLIILIILLCKSNMGFSQKSNLDSLVKLSPKLPTVLEFREANLMERLSLVPGKTFPPNNEIRICCCGNGASPLFTLDGNEITDTNGIDPKSIESIEVLKGKSSVEIYGKKGENDVIIITSKRK